MKKTAYWVDIKLAQKKGLKFYQTRSNGIILYNTFPNYSIPKAVRMETGEIIYEKVFASPRPPPKISFKDNWMKELASEVARQAECSQPIQPNPNPIYRTERPVVTEPQEIDTRFSLDCENTYLFVERLEKDEDTDKDVVADRDRTERPFVDIDRFQGVWIATCSWVVKQAWILVFVNSWRRSSNEEPFELCEKIPKVQCSECPLYWNQGIFHNEEHRDPNMLMQIKQVRRDPCWWIKKKSTKLISEYQDCHMLLWKKQNISKFKSLWKDRKSSSSSSTSSRFATK